MIKTGTCNYVLISHGPTLLLSVGRLQEITDYYSHSLACNLDQTLRCVGVHTANNNALYLPAGLVTQDYRDDKQVLFSRATEFCVVADFKAKGCYSKEMACNA